MRFWAGLLAAIALFALPAAVYDRVSTGMGEGLNAISAGRVDDVMNISGHRISTTEVESALVDHPSVAEAAVVGANDPLTGQAVIAFVTLKGGNPPSPQHGELLRSHVATKIGPIAKPKQIVFTDDLPKTRSGKIMRRLLRDMAEGRQLGDTTTLADPNVMALIKERAALSSED